MDLPVLLVFQLVKPAQIKTCNTGSFYNSTTARCDKCIDYCATCSNTVSCDSCITGFQLIYASLSSSTLIGCG